LRSYCCLFNLQQFINKNIELRDKEKIRFQYLYDPLFYLSWDNVANNSVAQNIFVIYVIYRYCCDITSILASHLTEEEYAQQIITDVITGYINSGSDISIFKNRYLYIFSIIFITDLSSLSLKIFLKNSR
jgi:hypothetical protein